MYTGEIKDHLIPDNYILVDLSHLKNNVNEVRKLAGTDKHIIAMVKSNAYGHGLIQVSTKLNEMGVHAFGVFTVKEGVDLRSAGITGQILIFGPIHPSLYAFLLHFNLTPVIGCIDEANSIMDFFQEDQVSIHIKIDTGMSRIGFLPDSAIQILEIFRKNRPNIIIDGICTHFSDSSSPDRKFTDQQANEFKHTLEILGKKGFHFSYIHAANSGAILQYPEYLFNAIRPGILLFGVDMLNKYPSFEPVLSLYSHVSMIKWIPKNAYVSYNRTYKTTKNTKIAIIPIGYADGYMYDFSNIGTVLINENFYPIIGTICMNQFVVDITDSENICLVDRVVVIGKDNGKSITLRSISALTNKLPYEILCRLSESMKRIYKNS
ncbi:MAG: alanine racemase [Caldisericia bacterium]|nr:alanine racemase [Caldisericia bacterium]